MSVFDSNHLGKPIVKINNDVLACLTSQQPSQYLYIYLRTEQGQIFTDKQKPVYLFLQDVIKSPYEVLLSSDGKTAVRVEFK